MGHAQLCSGKLGRHIRCVLKITRCPDRHGQEEIRSGQRAGLCDVARTAQLLESGQPHQSSQRQPVAGHVRGRDRPCLNRSKGRRTEPGQRIDVSHRGLRVLEHQAAVGQRKHGAEAAIYRGHLDLLVTRKLHRHVRAQEKHESPLDGHVVRTSQAHRRGRLGSILLRALAQQRDLRPWSIHRHRSLQLPPVPQLHGSSVMPSRFQAGRRAIGVHRQLIQILYPAQRGWSQSNPAHTGLFHLIQACAPQQCDGVAGTQRQPVQ